MKKYLINNTEIIETDKSPFQIAKDRGVKYNNYYVCGGSVDFVYSSEYRKLPCTKVLMSVKVTK